LSKKSEYWEFLEDDPSPIDVFDMW
jgi:hypothetical protein